MEKTNHRKIIYVVISILIALLVWFYANGNTQVLITVDAVPVEFLNADTSLADKGLMLV